MKNSILKASLFVIIVTLSLYGCGKKENERVSSEPQLSSAERPKLLSDSIGTESNGNSTDFTKAVSLLKKVQGVDRSPKYHEFFPVFSTGKSINAVEFAVILNEKSKPKYLIAVMDSHSIPPDSASEAGANIMPSRSDDASFPEELKELCFGSCACYNKENLYVFVYGNYSGKKTE